MALETNLELKEGVTPDLRSPRYFGAEGDPPQETFITDQPLEVSRVEYDSLKTMCQRIADFIDKYPLEAESSDIGADKKILSESLEIDKHGESKMRYGGLDVYQDPDQGFKILEINPRVQAMGLQDYRQEELGMGDQPALLKDFVEWTKDRSYQNVLVLGSKKNPFWRGCERIAKKLVEGGVNGEFYDVQELVDKSRKGYKPDLILKLCNNNQFLDGQFSDPLKGLVEKHKIPILNPLHATYFGYRGFMTELTNELSELFPDQYLFNTKTSEVEIQGFSWIKLEAAGHQYVVNYNELRRWGKDALLSLINRDFPNVERILGDKEGGDAQKIKKVRDIVQSTPNDQVVWLGQSDVEPRSANLKIAGIDTRLKILHRVYWFRKDDGSVNVSIEGFGNTDAQFQRSKGKINAGTGYSVPMLIK